MTRQALNRRHVLSAGALYTTNIFANSFQGANNKTNAAFIGVGRMGSSNLGFALRQENVVVTQISDVFEPNLQRAIAATGKQPGGPAKAVRDFREILADKSIDVVCVSTPDHWHAYMTVEACKAGKDVYVEKPVSVTIDEGKKMVEAARKYKRVVQAGTMQRSAVHFQKAAEIVKSGMLGKITFVRTWNTGLSAEEGIGNPPDENTPPENVNWDMWLGPAPARKFNKNRFGIDTAQVEKQRWFPHFRWFWDYAGGMMTDWGIHWLDIVQMAFDEAMPTSCVAIGGKYYLKDNRETPDTLQVTYEYPGFVATYENRTATGLANPYERGGGITFQGTKATMYVDRSMYKIYPERNSNVEAVEVKATDSGNANHWKNFLECVRTRQKPQSDIEKCFRSTSTCHLGNIALRSKMRVDWDNDKQIITQAEPRKYMVREYRKPWKLTV
jgi:predicted dehydrogenase